jgi:NAD(P)-dependent dehydrogenase (short-subunit alcohol dehydrogenase family)
MGETKCAVITGAGSGIGRACVARYSSDGYRVVAIGRRGSALQETAADIGGSAGELVLAAGDVRNRAELDQIFKDIGQIDVLVANAGVCKRTWLNEDESDAVWNEIIDININGVWHTFRAADPYLADGAAAVIISSGLGKLGRPGYGAYTASKHAVLGMVKCFAPELAPRGVRVNAVCPGWVDTEMAARDLVITAEEQAITPDEAKAAAVAGIPLKRFVSADEVARLIRFLTSSDASAITGQSYNISCGEFTV